MTLGANLSAESAAIGSVKDRMEQGEASDKTVSQKRLENSKIKDLCEITMPGLKNQNTTSTMMEERKAPAPHNAFLMNQQ